MDVGGDSVHYHKHLQTILFGTYFAATRDASHVHTIVQSFMKWRVVTMAMASWNLIAVGDDQGPGNPIVVWSH